VGGFGDVPEYTGTLEYDSFELLYRKTYEHTEYAKGMAVERKLIDDEEYGVMSQRTQLFGLAFDRKIYKDAASVFNNAFSSSYLGGDNKALCASDHPYSPTNASTQSNVGTTALSYDAVLATERLMMGMVDSRGNALEVMPDTILVPVALKETALTIVNSPLKPGTPNNDANAAGGYRVVVSRYLTDANNWFLIDSRLAKLYLNWFWRVKPEFEADPTGDFSLAARFRGYVRYAFGFDAYPWIYGHNVA
jgi:phage major head subunit gpT-like protein